MGKTPGRLRPHEAIAWQAVAKHAAGEAERDSVPVGEHAVDLRVTGTAGGERFDVAIAGQLTIAADGVRSISEKPSPAAVVAWLLAELAEDDDARRGVLRRLPLVWADELAELPAEEIRQAEQLLERLRRRAGTAPKRGDVTFTPTASK